MLGSMFMFKADGMLIFLSASDGLHSLVPAAHASAWVIPFTLHMDSPVRPVNAIDSIHTALNRRTTAADRVSGLYQRLAPLSAVKIYPINAKGTELDTVAGTLVLCYFVDFVILSNDPLAVPYELLELLLKFCRTSQASARSIRRRTQQKFRFFVVLSKGNPRYHCYACFWQYKADNQNN